LKGEEKTGASEVGTRNDRSQGTAESLCHNRADTRCATGNDEHFDNFTVKGPLACCKALFDGRIAWK